MRTQPTAATLAVIGLAALLAAPNSAPPLAQELGPWQSTAEESQLGAEVRRLLNEARAQAALGGLTSNPQLDLLAYQHAREMAIRGSVTHHSHLYGASTRTRFELAFPDLRQFGENVAVNRSPDALHSALMNSSGHRLNRMEPTFTHVGIGVARASEYQLYLTEVFARVFDDATIAEIAVLYTQLPPDSVAQDDPNYGEVRGETVRIGPPKEDNPEFWTQRGIDAYNGGRFAEAIELFSRSIAIDAGYVYAHYNLARAYLANDEPGRALTILEQQIAQDPADADAWSSSGSALLLLQRFEEAVEAFNHVLRLRARDAGSWYNLGLAHEMQGNLDTAERAYRQALHVQPDLAEAAAALARIR